VTPNLTGGAAAAAPTLTPAGSEARAAAAAAPTSAPAVGIGKVTLIEELCHDDNGQQRSMPVDLDTAEGLCPDDVLGVLLVKELIMVGG